MSVFAPTTIGIKSTQTFGKLVYETTGIQHRVTGWVGYVVSAAEINHAAQLVVTLTIDVLYDKNLDISLRWRANTASWVFAEFASVLTDTGGSQFTGAAFLGPYAGDAPGATAYVNAYNVPLLNYYPNGYGFYIMLRGAGGLVAPAAGECTLRVHGWY